MKWEGVMPAITTPFLATGEIDHDFVRYHVAWLVDHGATGIIPCGSLGEGSTLSAAEKVALMKSCVQGVSGRVPVIPGIAAAATRDAVNLSIAAQDAGCSGLMVLPPYLHNGKFDEVVAHMDAVFEATDLPTMLYNNPIAYGVDFLPETIANFAAKHSQLGAVKDSSGDARRFTAMKAILGERLVLFAGLDDVVVEAVAAGARGWVAGLVNAMPQESQALFDAALAGNHDEAAKLYAWFLPLLRMDTVPEFVQLIKLVQEKVGKGSETVRMPRQPVQGQQREEALKTIEVALKNRPEVNHGS